MKRQKLIEARKKQGMTQKEVAHKAAMQQTMYSRKERGLSPIRREEWIRFAYILNIGPNDINSLK